VAGAPGVSEQLAAPPGHGEKTLWPTATTKCCARISRPIAMASLVDPPGELISIGSRRPPKPAIKCANTCAMPTSIWPSAEIHSGQFCPQLGAALTTRTNFMVGAILTCPGGSPLFGVAGVDGVGAGGACHERCDDRGR